MSFMWPDNLFYAMQKAFKRISGNNSWVILGDINVTLNIKEHSSGGSHVTEEMQDFRDCINAIEIKVIGCLDLTARVEALRVKLQEAQSLVERDPHNSVIKSRAIDVLFEYNEAVKDVEKLLAQKVRIDWLNEEDKNNAFYHKVMKGRRSRNRVDTICDENEVKFIQEEVPIQFVKHFQQFLGTSYEASVLSAGDDFFSNTLTQEEDDFMVRKISDNEVKEKPMLIWRINRAPGPDGFSSFFKRAWNVVGKDVSEAIKEFFNNGLMLIAAVLESMSMYWASVFKLPKSVIKEINGILKWFLWSNGDPARGKVKLSWK
ncbi:hypothetical protein Tco_1352644 [Tanacetum coccineum]